MLSDACEQNEPFAREADVSLNLSLPAAPVLATIDASRLLQAVTNLISNAAKFAPCGSTVRLGVQQIGEEACIFVEDQGPGIPANFRHRLFDRFSQSEQPTGKVGLPGTGLGLAIARSMVEQLGGRIRLDEAFQSGTRFEIFLPLDIGRRTVAA